MVRHRIPAEIWFSGAMVALMLGVSLIFRLPIRPPAADGAQFVGIHYLFPLCGLVVCAACAMIGSKRNMDGRSVLLALPCFAAVLFAPDIQNRHAGRNVMVVSPDVGGVVRARALAKRLNVDLAIIDKRRERAGVSEVMNVIGDVGGRDCILVDDICDSGGTLCNAADALIAEGAHSVSVYVTHGVLSGGAIARIAASPIEMMTFTDSIMATEAVRLAANLRQISIASLLAEAMRRISDESSVSSLFD